MTIAAPAFLLFGLAAAAQDTPMRSCDFGAIVEDNKDFDYCSAFVQPVLTTEQGAIDRKLEAIIASDGSLKNKIRSYAFIISISHYEHIQNPELRDLKGVNDEFDPLIKLLKDQGFDEIVKLREGDASVANINYFMNTYFFNEFKSRKEQNLLTRFLFLYDGHGIPGVSSDVPGAIALAGATGDDDNTPTHLVPLDVLHSQLGKLAALSYETLALIGACFSGGIFQKEDAAYIDFYYPPGPGAHAITAAKDNELAWTAPPPNSGTIFFNRLLNEIHTRHASAAATEGWVISSADGTPATVPDGFVRLDTIISEINPFLHTTINPKTHKPYPDLIIGNLLPANQARNGAFFFLEEPPEEKPAAIATEAAAAPASAPASKGLTIQPDVTNHAAHHHRAKTGDALGGAIVRNRAIVPGRTSGPSSPATVNGTILAPPNPASQRIASAPPVAPEPGGAAKTPPDTPSNKPAVSAEASPQASEEAPKSAAAPPQAAPTYDNVSALPPTTGSAVLHHPELKVFKRPEFYPIRGVALSKFSGTVPFDLFAQRDIRFAYIKATEGGELKDAAFDGLRAGAARATIATGAYHFFTFCDSAAAQFANIARQNIEATDLPFAVDIEWFNGPADPKQRPCAGDVEKVKQNLHLLLEMIKERYNKAPVIYAPSSSIGTIIDSSFDAYPIWLADYHKVNGVNSPTMRGANPWTMWQFTDHAQVPGFEGPVDLNVFFGTEEQFASFAKGQGNVALKAAEGER